MYKRIKAVWGRDKLFSVLLIFSLMITVLMVFIFISTNGTYNEKIANSIDSSENYFENAELTYDEYQNILFFSLVNCTVVVRVWLVRRCFEFAVRKTFGSTNLMLWLRMLGELMCLIVIATVLALVFFLLLITIGVVEGRVVDLFNDCFIIFLSDISVCFITLTLNCSFICKLSPVQLLCRGKV